MNQYHWERVRAHYRHNSPEILACEASDWAIDPYAWDRDAGIALTPIESWLWSDIRAAGGVLYPQYPVGRYFVDFASPRARVAIECDGARWHTDKARDAARQAEIERMGWSVYRFTGAECRIDADPTNGMASETYRRIAVIAERHGFRYAPTRPRATAADFTFESVCQP